MKALSIRQPWASMIVLGFKPVENRSWKSNFRGRMKIHAGKKFDHQGAAWIIETFPDLQEQVLAAKKLCGGIVGAVTMTDCVEHFDSPWFFGPRGFVFEDPEQTVFQPFKGRLNFFDAPPDPEKPFTTDQAAEQAVKWCKAHPGWQRICDIEDTDSLYEQWEDLPYRARKFWENECRSDPKGSWQRFETAKSKVPTGFISGAGFFYDNALDVPACHNMMMVFKTGVENG
jgi:hypothetical protein